VVLPPWSSDEGSCKADSECSLSSIGALRFPLAARANVGLLELGSVGGNLEVACSACDDLEVVACNDLEAAVCDDLEAACEDLAAGGRHHLTTLRGQGRRLTNWKQLRGQGAWQTTGWARKRAQGQSKGGGS
jgi:hypothetical protein